MKRHTDCPVTVKQNNKKKKRGKTVDLSRKEKNPIMADKEVEKQVVIEEEEEEDKEKWVKHYSSNHQILLVGDGDFSFALSLAVSFGSGSNIVASSLDTFDVLIKKYKKAKSNLENLTKLGASTLHGVDATKMKVHPDLKTRKFDRIIFNFPHAGFHGKEDGIQLIEMHRNLVRRFFMNANGMLLADGEIHVNHKTTAPFCHWNIEELAQRNSLVLIECVEFKIEDYPGYNNKRGDSNRCDESFPLGESSTFKFRFSLAAMMSKSTSHLGFTGKRPQQLQDNLVRMQHQPSLHNHMHPRTTFLDYKHTQPTLFKRTHPQPIIFDHKRPQSTSFNHMHHQPTLFNRLYPQASLATNMSEFPGYMHSPSTISIRNADVFNGYYNPRLEPHSRTANPVNYSYNDSWKCDYKIYMPEEPGRTLEGDLYVLRELQHLSNLRSALWRRTVLTHGPRPEGTEVWFL